MLIQKVFWNHDEEYGGKADGSPSFFLCMCNSGTAFSWWKLVPLYWNMVAAAMQHRSTVVACAPTRFPHAVPYICMCLPFKCLCRKPTLLQGEHECGAYFACKLHAHSVAMHKEVMGNSCAVFGSLPIKSEQHMLQPYTTQAVKQIWKCLSQQDCQWQVVQGSLW